MFLTFCPHWNSTRYYSQERSLWPVLNDIVATEPLQQVQWTLKQNSLISFTKCLCRDHSQWNTTTHTKLWQGNIFLSSWLTACSMLNWKKTRRKFRAAWKLSLQTVTLSAEKVWDRNSRDSQRTEATCLFENKRPGQTKVLHMKLTMIWQNLMLEWSDVLSM